MQEKMPALDAQTAYLLIKTAGHWGYMQCIQTLWEHSKNNTDPSTNPFPPAENVPKLRQKLYLLLHPDHEQNSSWLEDEDKK